MPSKLIIGLYKTTFKRSKNNTAAATRVFMNALYSDSTQSSDNTTKFASRIPGTRWIANIVSKFTHTEKLIAGIFALVLCLSTVALLLAINNKFLVEIPAQGGMITEGVVGIPRFINPILAFTDADRDLSALIYSGLMKFDGVNVVPDIAQSYTVSSDGRVYTFTLRDDVFFHDGVKLTAQDVEFTVLKAQDPELKSPIRASWDKVKVEVVSDYNIRFTLDRAYEPFITNMTLGILPKHMWSTVPPEQFTFSNYNIEPIGSGPFLLETIIRDKGGLPTAYKLIRWNKFHTGESYLDGITLRFYTNERELIESYNEGIIDGMNSISPKEAQRLHFLSPKAIIERIALPRIFGVFYNQSQNEVLAMPEVRQALSVAINRERIVQEVLAGYGIPITSALPYSILGSTTRNQSEPLKPMQSTTTDTFISDARSILTKAGWTLASSSDSTSGSVFIKKTKTKTHTLDFTLTTSNAPELKRAGELAQEQWERLGAQVSLKVFETGDLNQNVIRPRNYDALLFGEVIGRDLDLFAFWHSSQRNDPGLNIALYTNSRADRLLEQIRTETSKEKRLAQFRELDTIIRNDHPATFIFSPDFIYIVPPKLHGMNLKHITTSADRFSSVTDWYVKTEHVWKFFTKNELFKKLHLLNKNL